MPEQNFEKWIEENDKYALIGLEVKTEDGLPSRRVSDGLWVIADGKFKIPVPWREWLGTIRADQMARCNLFLLSKRPSAVTGVLDAENKALEQTVWHGYVGLLLASNFSPAHRPVMLTGARRNGVVDVRQQQDFDVPLGRVFHPYPAVTRKDIENGAAISAGIDGVTHTKLAGGHWRLFRTLHIYIDARTNHDTLERLHQYARCIDGLILPDAGETKRQFKSRTELFVGPRHHDLMGAIYDARSADEHLNENKYLEEFDRDVRLELLKNETIVEHMATSALARIFTHKELWEHFCCAAALTKFWKLNVAERQTIWGGVIDPLDALVDFDPKFIHDGLLGK